MVTLRFKKTLEGHATLTLIRPDGSSAWTSIGAWDGFGPMHDLAHVVVERQLFLPGALLGRVAQGDDFPGYTDRFAGKIGPEAVRAEATAGLLSLEVMTGRPLKLEAFNDAVQDRCAEMRPGCRAPELTPTALHSMRAELASLRREWEALEEGATLELRFGGRAPVPAASVQ